MAKKITDEELTELETLVNNWLKARDLIDATRTAKFRIDFYAAAVVEVRDRGRKAPYRRTDEVLTDKNWQELLGCEELSKIHELMEVFRSHNNLVKKEQIPDKLLRSFPDGSSKYFDYTAVNTLLKKVHSIGALPELYRVVEFVNRVPFMYRIAICKQ